jgi:alpha-glucosidase
MTRLRGAYDALQQSPPFASAPDPLIDAMQTGDRLGYRPERAVAEIAHFHNLLPEAQSSVDALEKGFLANLDKSASRISAASPGSSEFEAQKQRRIDTFNRAERLVTEAGK